MEGSREVAFGIACQKSFSVPTPQNIGIRRVSSSGELRCETPAFRPGTKPLAVGAARGSARSRKPGPTRARTCLKIVGSTTCETGAFAMSDKPIGPLRQRMIDDMTARRFSEDTQRDYVRNVRNFTAFLGDERRCSPLSTAYGRSSRSAQGRSTRRTGSWWREGLPLPSGEWPGVRGPAPWLKGKCSSSTASRSSQTSALAKRAARTPRRSKILIGPPFLWPTPAPSSHARARGE